MIDNIPAQYLLGGITAISRIGLGTMQLVGPGAWGQPADRRGAISILRRAVELGINFIDTADSYGPSVAESLICEALAPYADSIVIATKAGLVRTGPNEWRALGRPEYLRQQVELSLRNLKLETIDLFQLHRLDPTVPLDDQIGELSLLQGEGKIRHIGVCEATRSQLEQARNIATISAVQNRYNVVCRDAHDVLEYATQHDIAFIAWSPLAAGVLTKYTDPIRAAASRYGKTPAQLSLKWLLSRSPAVIAIPGTADIAHLEENWEAGSLLR